MTVHVRIQVLKISILAQVFFLVITNEGILSRGRGSGDVGGRIDGIGMFVDGSSHLADYLVGMSLCSTRFYAMNQHKHSEIAHKEPCAVLGDHMLTVPSTRLM